MVYETINNRCRFFATNAIQHLNVVAFDLDSAQIAITEISDGLSDDLYRPTITVITKISTKLCNHVTQHAIITEEKITNSKKHYSTDDDRKKQIDR